MSERLIDFLLGALPDEEADAVQREVAANEQIRRELQRLRNGLSPLEADLAFEDVPPGLAARTCHRIRNQL